MKIIISFDYKIDYNYQISNDATTTSINFTIAVKIELWLDLC